jgi:hypothetical protein
LCTFRGGNDAFQIDVGSSKLTTLIYNEKTAPKKHTYNKGGKLTCLEKSKSCAMHSQFKTQNTEKKSQEPTEKRNLGPAEEQ